MTPVRTAVGRRFWMLLAAAALPLTSGCGGQATTITPATLSADEAARTQAQLDAAAAAEKPPTPAGQ